MNATLDAEMKLTNEANLYKTIWLEKEMKEDSMKRCKWTPLVFTTNGILRSRIRRAAQTVIWLLVSYLEASTLLTKSRKPEMKISI